MLKTPPKLTPSRTPPHDPSFWYQEGEIVVTEYTSYRSYSSDVNIVLAFPVLQAYLQAEWRVEVGWGDEPVVGEREWYYGNKLVYFKIEPGPRMTWLMLCEMLKDVEPFWRAKKWTGGFRFQVWLRNEVEVVGKGELYADLHR